MLVKRNEREGMTRGRWELGDGENGRRDEWSACLIGMFNTRN
jgi:hypothetical protein